MSDHSALVWDAVGTRFYETGDDHGVIYLPDANGNYSTGAAWNGLTAVTISPEGAEATDLWADNIKYGSIRSAETVKGTIEAYTYPDEFAECNGEKELVAGMKIGQQPRKKFGFCFRSQVGNDITEEAGYILHILYGCTASPSEKGYATKNDSPEAITFSWEFDTTPVPVVDGNGVAVSGAKPTATIEIDSRTVDATKLAALEAILYGSSQADARLPLPYEIYTTLS